jgi:hypothetical protein
MSVSNRPVADGSNPADRYDVLPLGEPGGGGMFMVRFVIQPHSEGGFLIFREGQLTAVATTLGRATALANELLEEERRTGRAGRVVLADIAGNVA